MVLYFKKEDYMHGKKSELVYNKLIVTSDNIWLVGQDHAFMLYICFVFAFKIFTTSIFYNKKWNFHVKKHTSVTFWLLINITIKWLRDVFQKKIRGDSQSRPTVFPFLHLLFPFGSQVLLILSKYTCNYENTISWTGKGHFHVRYLLGNIKVSLHFISHSPFPIGQDKKTSGEIFSWI